MSRVLAGLCSSISSQILAPLRGSQACSPCAVASKACSCRGLRFTSAHLRAHSDMSSVVAEKFVKGGVVPDVITTAPVNAAKVLYPSGELDFGNVMTPTQVQDPPKVVTYPTEEGALYTLIKTDPDAPSRADPEFREWRHWLVVNIPGCDVGKGEEVAAYIGAGPPEGTGLHRYVFLVYKQNGRITYTDPKLGLSVDNRGCTKANDVAQKYGLGSPVAGNFYQAEWDDYVPKLYEKLGNN